MKIGSQAHRHTAISAANPDTIVVRGLDLCEELIGRVSFTDHVWLLVAGALPNDAQRRVLDAALVAIAEHGLVPSVQAARMTLAAAPEAIQGAVAAGLLGCGSVILGASESAGRLFADIVARADGGDLAVAARAVLGEYRAARRPIPGYGHSLHSAHDPRAHRLFAVAREVGLHGRHCEAAFAGESLLPEILGKRLRMNVSAGIPAVLLDAGFPLLALKGVPILARTASLVAHLLEEQQRGIGFVLSGAAEDAVGYDGPVPPGFVPGDR